LSCCYRLNIIRIKYRMHYNARIKINVVIDITAIAFTKMI
jgi:hypothetical protein